MTNGRVERALRGPRWSLAALATLLAACASSQGDALLREGAYVQAEARLTEELAAHPDDAALRARRDEARTGALRSKLEKARETRLAGHAEASLALLAQAIGLQRKWSPLALPPEVEAARDTELGSAAALVDGLIAPDLDAHRPLRASRALARLEAAFLEPRSPKARSAAPDPNLAPAFAGARARVAVEGAARCADLRTRITTPYLTRLLARYCATFAVAVEAPAPPDARRGLRLSGRADNMNDAQHAATQRWLALAFRDSPWYAPEAADLFDGRLSGSFDPEISQQTVTLSAPYQATVRSRIDRGPFMDPVRVVTQEERVFTYEAEEYKAHYDVSVAAHLELVGNLDPLRVAFEAEERSHTYVHGVSFPPAGVRPVRGKVLPAGDWLVERLGRQQAPAVERLTSFWKRAFCQGAAPAAEDAARCARGAPRTPGLAPALATLFGDDAAALIDLLAEPPRPRRDAARLPEIVDVAAPARGDEI